MVPWNAMVQTVFFESDHGGASRGFTLVSAHKVIGGLFVGDFEGEQSVEMEAGR